MPLPRRSAAALGLCLVLCQFLPGSGLAAEPLKGQAAWSRERIAVLHAPGEEPRRSVSRHYLWSNEQRHDLFFEDVHGLRGGYIGVGADQNYTLAAASSAEMVWLIDLDAAVIHLHRLYAALIAAAPTAEDFLSLMDGRRPEAVTASVLAWEADPAEQRQARGVYEQYHDVLLQRLRRTYRQRVAGGPTTWLSDPQMYRYVRQLVLSGRLVARLGDLNGPRTLRQIGEAARAGNVVVRVLYLSNAESWFPYCRRFAENLHSLPLDPYSVVLRTVKSDLLRYATGDFWHFSVQGAEDFVQKLLLPGYVSIDRIMEDVLLDPDPPMEKARGLSHVPPGPADGPHRDVQQGVVTRPTATPDIPLGDG